MNQATIAAPEPVPAQPSWLSRLRKALMLGQAITTSAKSALSPEVWDRARDRVVRWVKDLALARSKYVLEQQLARIVETANGHQGKGLPSGSPIYMALHRQAHLKIDAFCAKHSVDRLTVEQDAPVLRDLEALTHAPSPAERVRKGITILGVTMVAATLVGCAGGLVATGYHWVVSLLAH